VYIYFTRTALMTAAGVCHQRQRCSWQRVWRRSSTDTWSTVTQVRRWDCIFYGSADILVYMCGAFHMYNSPV